jgi:hypothetical protein
LIGYDYECLSLPSAELHICQAERPVLIGVTDTGE